MTDRAMASRALSSEPWNRDVQNGTFSVPHTKHIVIVQSSAYGRLHVQMQGRSALVPLLGSKHISHFNRGIRGTQHHCNSSPVAVLLPPWMLASAYAFFTLLTFGGCITSQSIIADHCPEGTTALWRQPPAAVGTICPLKPQRHGHTAHLLLLDRPEAATAVPNLPAIVSGPGCQMKP